MERDSIKLFEVEEELARLRNEISCATNSQNSQLQGIRDGTRSMRDQTLDFLDLKSTRFSFFFILRRAFRSGEP